MPAAYYAAHTPAEQWAHRAIVERRAGRGVVVEPCLGSTEWHGTGWLCVVTEDRPGLLSLISAAIAACSLDVLGARVYTRRRDDGPAEAVDLFAVRGLEDPLGVTSKGERVALIRDHVEGLLTGRLALADLERRGRLTPRPGVAVAPDVWFDEKREGFPLVVVTADRPGLLLGLCFALYRAGVNVVHSEVTTVDGVARDEFEVAEFDGTALTPERRRGIAALLRVVAE